MTSSQSQIKHLLLPRGRGRNGENGHAFQTTPTSPPKTKKKKSWANFETFCSCTSLHGWKYLSKTVNKTLRLCWVGVVLASMGVAAFFLGYSLNDFLASTVQTTQDTSR